MAESKIYRYPQLSVPDVLNGLTDYLFDQTSEDLTTLMPTAFSSGNKRKIILDKNRVKQDVVAGTPSGSTYATFLISKTPRYLGTTYANSLSNLTAEDFKPFDLEDYEVNSSRAVLLHLSGVSTRTYANTEGTGLRLIICTRDNDTGNITTGTVTVRQQSLVKNKTQFARTAYSMSNVTGLYTNKNIAFLWESRYPDVIQNLEVHFESYYLG